VVGRAARGAVACDLNAELVTAWQAVKRDPHTVNAALETYAVQDSEAFYYSVRAKRFHAPLDRAAHFIYLNRTSWNGLYRVNGRGEFNVPWGARAFSAPRLDALTAVAQRVASTQILTADFREVLDRPVAGDFVYLDPPYLKISDTSKFNGYTQQRFRRQDLDELLERLDDLTRRGVRWVLSNRDSDLVSELFSDYKVIRMTVRRSVAAQNKRHVEARYSPEVLVTNAERW
jgi:DNA adenine methylase